MEVEPTCAYAAEQFAIGLRARQSWRTTKADRGSKVMESIMIMILCKPKRLTAVRRRLPISHQDGGHRRQGVDQLRKRILPPHLILGGGTTFNEVMTMSLGVNGM
eukprot:GHVN01096826.1.p1 GENE.GHVN01096826.1~~GHVN01096826.1.p1  ORF type:complete len:105 (-),score=21.38 GHVN01096826.1:196-510(-)